MRRTIQFESPSSTPWTQNAKPPSSSAGRQIAERNAKHGTSGCVRHLNNLTFLHNCSRNEFCWSTHVSFPKEFFSSLRAVSVPFTLPYIEYKVKYATCCLARC